MIIAMLIFLLPLAYSPGPGNLFFAAAGARLGLRATLAASAGYHVATFAVTLAIGLGGFAAIAQVPAAFKVIKIIGAAYVIWIAWRFFRATPGSETVCTASVRFTDGVLLLILNPKAYVIISLLFSQFLSIGSEGTWGQVWIISTIFTLNNLMAFTIWTLAGARLAHVFSHPTHARILNKIFACALVGIALWMVIA